MSTSTTIGFIGLGNMGGHMAHNLLKAGHNVMAFDISPTNTATASSRGARVASSLPELAAQCGVIVTMLPSSPHVLQVYCGADSGLLHHVKPNTLLIDSSTIDPATAREVSAAAAAKQLAMVDAPVSGGVGGAEAGTLTFMVGGEKTSFEAVHPYLSKMGKNVVHCGGPGTGQVGKVCNNMLLGITMVGVSESYNLGVKLGMDPKLLAGIINTSTGRCWSSDTYNPVPGILEGVPSSRNYDGGFGVDLMKKDLGLAMAAANSVDAQMPLGKYTLALYEELSKKGLGMKDFGVVFDYLNKHH